MHSFRTSWAVRLGCIDLRFVEIRALTVGCVGFRGLGFVERKERVPFPYLTRLLFMNPKV